MTREETRENDDAETEKANAYKKKKALFFYRQDSTNSGRTSNSINLNERLKGYGFYIAKTALNHKRLILFW